MESLFIQLYAVFIWIKKTILMSGFVVKGNISLQFVASWHFEVQSEHLRKLSSLI